MERLAADLRMSNAERRRLVSAADDQTDLSHVLQEAEFRRILFRLGEQTFHDRARLVWAARPDIASPAYWKALMDEMSEWTRPLLPISGEDVIAIGVTPGPQVGEVLREVETWWVDSDFPEDVAVIARQMKDIALNKPRGG